MSLPDLIVLAVVLAIAAWRLLAASWRPTLRMTAVGFAVLLALAKWRLVGFTWQDLAAFPLLALSALPPRRTNVALRWIGRSGFVAVASVSLGVWLLPAVPTLPEPDGPYPVGTEVYRWTDVSRDEPRSPSTQDRRSVIAQAWYPAIRRDDASGATIPYIDGVGRMPRRVSGLPSFFLRRYGEIDTHAEASARLAPGDRPWPVVIFSPGYGAARAVYTGLATRLASRGFVVFVLDHPYESGFTELPNGDVVGTVEHFIPGEPRTSYMAEQQRVRTADIRFVIDQLARPEVLTTALRGSRLEASKVAVIGHSFGGAVSAMVLSEDPRVVAAANIDGTPYGDLPDRQLSRPFLLLQSDLDEAPHGALFHEGNGKLLAAMTAPGFRYELKHSDHYGFTDAPFFIAPLGRWLLAKAIGGARGPAATQVVTADILEAFLSEPLTGVAADVDAAAARHPNVSGGRVARGQRASGRAGAAFN